MANVARLRRKALPYSFVLPLSAILLLVNFYPLAYSLRLSLSVWPMEKFTEGPTFAGLVNYQRVFESERMWALALVHAVLRRLFGRAPSSSSG